MDMPVDLLFYMNRIQKLGHLNEQTTAYKLKRSGSSSWNDSRSSQPIAQAKATQRRLVGANCPTANDTLNFKDKVVWLKMIPNEWNGERYTNKACMRCSEKSYKWWKSPHEKLVFPRDLTISPAKRRREDNVVPKETAIK